MNTRRVGNVGEGIAEKYLAGRGMQILQCNYSCRQGEIDIIARDGEWLVFVEVKARSTVRMGAPAEAVNGAKRRHILHTALHYMQLHGLLDSRVRFDVVEILPGEIRHIPAAFDATDIL